MCKFGCRLSISIYIHFYSIVLLFAFLRLVFFLFEYDVLPIHLFIHFHCLLTISGDVRITIKEWIFFIALSAFSIRICLSAPFKHKQSKLNKTKTHTYENQRTREKRERENNNWLVSRKTVK